MKRTDYLTKDDGTLQIADGDFVRGDGSHQHIRLTIQHEVGEDRFQPTLAVGAAGYLHAPNPQRQGLLNKMKEKLSADQFQVRRVYVDINGNIQVDAQ